MHPSLKYIYLFYIAVSIGYLAAIQFLPADLVFWIKCSLMPILLVAIVLQGNFQYRNLLLAAVGFSWIGDAVISFADRGEQYFLLGLGAFLIAQICYIITFRRSTRLHPQNRGYPANGWMAAGIFAIALFIFLAPRLGNMLLPVLIYAGVITAMVVMALRGWAHWPFPYCNLVVAGAASFVLSDSLLAINKFHTPLPFSGQLIMSTYLIAQGLITFGMLHILKREL
jgi:uncharacterized membrane protein YhhN